MSHVESGLKRPLLFRDCRSGPDAHGADDLSRESRYGYRAESLHDRSRRRECASHRAPRRHGSGYKPQDSSRSRLGHVHPRVPRAHCEDGRRADSRRALHAGPWCVRNLNHANENAVRVLCDRLFLRSPLGMIFKPE